jgi:hypothetical protein
MNGLKFSIKRGRGKYNLLDRTYEKFINESLINCDDYNFERWELYSSIMDELLNMGKYEYFEEAKYRMTEGENPNYVMKSIHEKDEDTRNFFSGYLNKIESYIEYDLITRFSNKKRVV